MPSKSQLLFGGIFILAILMFWELILYEILCSKMKSIQEVLLGNRLKN